MNNAVNLEPLKKLIGEAYVITEGDDLQQYALDWSKLFSADALAIVRPESVEQVQAIVQWANKNQIAIVPSGGRTGLSGGACATSGELVLSLDRMNKIISFDPVNQSVLCQAGVITAQLQSFAEEQGLFYPVDFASAGSSQLGGNIATNAGGIKVIRWGLTRDWVLGLKVVTGGGEILELNAGLIKNATGYDFRHLMIGSEGTLGIIVEATMKLTQPPKELTVMVLGLSELGSVYPVLTEFQRQLPLTAFEFFSEAALQKVLAHHDLPRPCETACDFYVLIEFENQHETTMDQAFACFEQAMEQGHVIDGVISQSETQAQQLWALRERISESISRFTPYKNDIAVTPSRVAEFLQRVDAIVEREYPAFEIIWFGHIGDGNLHLNILRPADLSIEAFVAQCQRVNPMIFQVIADLKGSISAEHGVGLVKKDYLNYSRSEFEVALMQQIKPLFDPNRILNPGKLFNLS